MNRARSFAPIEDVSARVLILGSMPGRKSLEMKQYYAHPHNLFWRILGELVGASPVFPYPHRVIALKRARIALWDVLKSCDREGSLDSSIDEDTLEPNDFKAFFRQHPRITHVFFNGAKAEAVYRKFVLQDAGPKRLRYHRLPSTSPANAGMPYAQRLKAWQAIRRVIPTQPQQAEESPP